MRRMYTTEGIQKLIDSSIDDAFLNIKDENIGSGLFEKIKDKDGHLRFIEGTGVIPSNVIPAEQVLSNKWSLSGSHFMLVVAFKLTTTKSVTAGEDLYYTSLPKWIADKIVGISGAQGVVESKQVGAITENGIPAGSSGAVRLYRYGNDQIILNCGDTFTLGVADTETYVRIQFDVLIDNA